MQPQNKGVLQNQREYHIILTKYEAVHPTVVLENKFPSWMLIISTRNLTVCINVYLKVPSKIEKVPRGIRGEKSSKDMASSRNLVSTIRALANPKMGDGTRCPEG